MARKAVLFIGPDRHARCRGEKACPTPRKTGWMQKKPPIAGRMTEPAQDELPLLETSQDSTACLPRRTCLRRRQGCDPELEQVGGVVLVRAARGKVHHRSEELLRALRYERALVYEGLGQHRRARSELEKFYAEDPYYEDVAARLGL